MDIIKIGNDFMKILLIILGILVALIVAILLFGIKISIKINYTDTIFTEIRLFGKPIKNKGTFKKILKHLGFKGTINFLFGEEIGFFSRLKYILKKLTVKCFKLDIRISSDDAAQTALLYGGVCSVVYPVVAFLDTFMTFKKNDINLVCDYKKEKSELYFFFEAKIKSVYLLIAGFKIIPIIKKILKEVKENEQ